MTEKKFCSIIAITAIGGATINGVDGSPVPGNVSMGSGHDINMTGSPTNIYAYGGDVLIGAAESIGLGTSTVLSFAKHDDNTGSSTIIGGNVAIISDSPGVNVAQVLSNLYHTGAEYNEVLVPSYDTTGTIDNPDTHLVGVVYSSVRLNGVLGDPSSRLDLLTDKNYKGLTDRVKGLLYISSGTQDPSSLSLSNAGFGAQQGQHPNLPPAPPPVPPSGGTSTGGVLTISNTTSVTVPFVNLSSSTTVESNNNTTLAGPRNIATLAALSNIIDHDWPLGGQVTKISLHGEALLPQSDADGNSSAGKNNTKAIEETIDEGGSTGNKLPNALGLLNAAKGTEVGRSNTSSNLIHTDGSANQRGESLGGIVQVGVMHHDFVLFTRPNQLMTGLSNCNNNDGLVITGIPGTVVSNDKGYVVLHSGRLLVDTGSKGFVLCTSSTKIMIGCQATVIIDTQPGKSVLVMSLAGKPDALTTVSTGQGEEISLKPGEELLVGQHIEKIAFSLASYDHHQASIASVSVSVGGAQARVLNHVFPAISLKTEQHYRSSMLNRLNTLAVKQVSARTGGSTAARILSDTNTQFQLVKPNVISITKGKIFIDTPEDIVVDSLLGQAVALKGACVAVDVQAGQMRIQALAGPGLVFAVAGNRKIALPPGHEVVISDSKTSDVLPTDGVGRRRLFECVVNNRLDLVFDDFSIVSFIKNASHLAAIRQPICSYDRSLQQQLLKCAAVVQQVTAYKGPYSAFVEGHQ